MRWSIALAFTALAGCSDDQGGTAGGEAGLCQNGRDDDGDGFTDCADQDCWSAAACGDASSADASGGDASDASPEVAPTDTTVPETTFDVPPETVSSCDPCGEKGSIKGRVCAPSANVFVNDARVWVEGTGCN